jgi:hypothetical protein
VRDACAINDGGGDMYDIGKEISDKYVILKDHIKRLQSSFRKYGRK